MEHNTMHPPATNDLVSGTTGTVTMAKARSVTASFLALPFE